MWISIRVIINPCLGGLLTALVLCKIWYLAIIYDWVLLQVNKRFFGKFVVLSFKEKCWQLETWESKSMAESFCPGYHLFFFHPWTDLYSQEGDIVYIGLLYISAYMEYSCTFTQIQSLSFASKESRTLRSQKEPLGVRYHSACTHQQLARLELNLRGLTQ